MKDESAISRVRGARHWAVLAASGTAASVSSRAARQVGAGASGLLVPQIFAPPWAALATAATSTDARLASGIALGFARSPFETAMAAIDLDVLSGGRFTLGLGTSTRDINEQRFGVEYDRPISRLRELTHLIRLLVTTSKQGEIGRFQGDFFDLDLRGVELPRPTGSTIPIYLAPLRETLTLTGAQEADGIFGHPIWPVDWIAGPVNDAIRSGLEQSGRSRESFRLVAWLRVVITDDYDEGVRDAKAGIPFYASLRQYESFFDSLGVGADARRLMDLRESGANPSEITAAVSDALVETLAVVGTPDEVARRIAPVLDVADELLLAPPNGLPGHKTRAYATAIADTLMPRMPRAIE